MWEHYSSDWTGMMRSSGGVEIDRDTGVSAEASGGHDYIPTEEVGSCRELLVAQLLHGVIAEWIEHAATGQRHRVQNLKGALRQTEVRR